MVRKWHCDISEALANVSALQPESGGPIWPIGVGGPWVCPIRAHSSYATVITKHNAHIIRNSQSQNMETDNCNCDNKNTCPLPKQCMTNNIIYKATVSTVTTNNTNDTKHYIRMTATTFKERYANHTSSFRHKKDSNKYFETYLEIKRKQSGLYHQMVNFKTRYFVHRGVKTL
jgi:hypothetical protein